MPSAVATPAGSGTGVTKFTNCRLVRGGAIVSEDLWVSSVTGRIVASQAGFYDDLIVPERTADLGGRLVSAGLIDSQLNGAFGFNFSTLLAPARYGAELASLNRRLVRTGVTSYLPTVTSQTPELYRAVLPFLGPSGAARRAADGAESLGAHVEGPFLNPGKNGVHNRAVLRVAQSFEDLEHVYGAANINPDAAAAAAAAAAKVFDSTRHPQDPADVVGGSDSEPDLPASSGSSSLSSSPPPQLSSPLLVSAASAQPPVVPAVGPLSSSSSPALPIPIPIKLITAAPELGGMMSLIPEVRSRGVLFSVGHTEATYEQARAAVRAGATMITHLFNAMTPLHHRNPGVFGVLGVPPAPDAPASPRLGPVASVRRRRQQQQQPLCRKPNQAMPAGATGDAVETRPFFGVIADGIHLHPAAVNLAYHAHPRGFVLVTDAMHMAGLPDGVYSWTNGDSSPSSPSSSSSSSSSAHAIVKRGIRLELADGSGTIAGSAVALADCVNHFAAWSGCGWAAALAAATEAPARMLGLAGAKGGLGEGMDADLVVWDEEVVEGEEDGEEDVERRTTVGGVRLVVSEVWKFGVRVYCRAEEEEAVE